MGEYYIFMHIFTSYYATRNMKEEERNTYIKFYRSVLAQVLNFKKTLEDFRDDYESIMELITLVQHPLSFRFCH